MEIKSYSYYQKQLMDPTAARAGFLAAVMHELKTPLSCIKLGLTLLKDDRNGMIDLRQLALVDDIQHETQRLSKIVSELLDLTRSEIGHIHLDPVPASPEEIVTYAVDSVKILIAQKEVDLQIRAAFDLPVVLADVEKTGWVLINFLSNALRYSSKRSRIVIELAVKTGKVIFSVRDFGKGIDQQYQKRLFVRYFQVPADSDNKAGSGLGLAISKEIVEAQNGEVWVKSVVGKGSVFSFSLPIAPHLILI